MEARGGQHDGVEFAVIQFAKASVDVAADVLDHEVGAVMSELCLATPTARTNSCALRQIVESSGCTRDDHVARILARRHCSEDQTVNCVGRQVFKAMDCEVSVARKHRALDFLREHAGSADVSDRARLLLIATGGDFDDLDLVAAGAKLGGNPIRLPSGELAGAGAESEGAGSVGGHGTVNTQWLRVRAATTTVTRAAPELRRIRVAALAVEPVVRMSSTSRT